MKLCIIMILFPCFLQAKVTEYEYDIKSEYDSKDGKCIDYTKVHISIPDNPNLPLGVNFVLQYTKCIKNGKTKIIYPGKGYNR